MLKNRMPVTYDKHYQTEHLFGDPYPELVGFFADYPMKGKVLDLGCGQGRDAIALARLGYAVTGIDTSIIGIEQMRQVGKANNLNLVGQVGDMYAFNRFDQFDIILLDSMLHFARKDKEKEIGLVKTVVSQINNGSLIAVCIQDIQDKVQILNRAIDFDRPLHRLADKKFKYIFEDKESGHASETDYRMIVAEKYGHQAQNP